MIKGIFAVKLVIISFAFLKIKKALEIYRFINDYKIL